MHIETQDNVTQQDAAPAEPSVEDEFDAAFAELDGNDDTPADKAAVDPKADEDDDSAEFDQLWHTLQTRDWPIWD